MNKAIFLAIIGLLTTLLVDPAVAGNITIVRSGASVDEFIDGDDNHSLEDSIYEHGILLGHGVGKATPTYRILLPPPTSGGTQITSITVIIKGTDAWLSRPYVYIGTPAQVSESIGSGENPFYFFGSDARNLLEDVGDGLGYTLNVKLDVGSLTDQYDLKEIIVTFEYSGVFSDILERFQQAYASYRTLQEYESGMINSLWDTGSHSSGYFYQAVQESLALADNLSGLSGSLFSSLKSTIDCIENFQNLGKILESAFDYTFFWIYYGGPSKSTVSSKLNDARDSFQIYAQNLFEYAFDGDLSSSDTVHLNSIIDTANTETADLRQTMRAVAQKSWSVYNDHDANYGGSTAQIMLYSLAPLLNITYNDTSLNSDEPSYLTGLIDNLTHFTTYTQVMGNLSVITTPVGGDIYVDEVHKGNGSWSGSMSAGVHSVSFGSVSGYEKPFTMTVAVYDNQITNVEGIYFYPPKVSGVVMSIFPDEAIAAGAQWRVDNGPWRHSGYAELYLSIGSHTIETKEINSWINLAPGEIEIEPSSWKSVYAVYKHLSLKVIIDPQDAVNAGAQWRVDGGPWRNSRFTERDLSVGNHTVEFKDITCWEKPDNQNITVTIDETTKVIESYTQSCGVDPHLSYLTRAVDDDNSGGSSGNGNGDVNSGETIELIVTLENTGSGNANNVSAQLSTSDEYVTISDANGNYGDISAGGTGSSIADYDFIVSSGCPGEHVVTFNLDIHSDEGSWTDIFRITIINPFPSNVEAQTGTNFGEIDLTWSAASGATGYNIYYAKAIDIGDSTDHFTIIDVGNVTQWGLNDLTLGEEYVFLVTAYNSDGETEFTGFAGDSAIAKGGVFTDTIAALPGVERSSVALGDYDNDGDLDILLTGETAGGHRISKVYRNDRLYSFTDIGAALPGVSDSSNRRVAWGDYDSDGDLDIVLAGEDVNGNPLCRIYQNNAGNFTDIGAGLPGVLLGSSVAWGDYDNDGDLDILLSGSTRKDPNRNPISRIYENNEGIFTDINAGIEGVAFSTSEWGDYDNDGDLDVIIGGNHLEGFTTKVYRNDEGNFLDINAVIMSSNFAAWGDYDNDNDLDLFVAKIPGDFTRLYKNVEGNFYHIYADLREVFGCNATWGDYNQDGYLDLLLTGDERHDKNVARIYRNSGENLMEISGAGLTGVAYGSVAWGDLDNDGDLDILLTGRDNLGNPIAKVYRNDYALNVKPTINIITPIGDNTVASTTVNFLFSGSAHDTDGSVSKVEYRLRSGSWQTANGTTNWDFTADLEVGPNLVEVYAQDNAGEYSETISRTITRLHKTYTSEPDNLPDWWEQQIIDFDPNDGINSVEDVKPGDDFDGDGWTNIDEYKRGTDPTHPSMAMPWIPLLLLGE